MPIRARGRDARTSGHTQDVLVAAGTRADVIERLAAAGCVAAEAEADEFLAAAPDATTLEAWLRRREQGEPPAWITGTTNFCGRTLHVVPGVYVPRTQTEDLARRAASLLPAHGRAVDLCTGTGAIAAHLQALVPTATVVAMDIDPHAAACARRNGVLALAADLAQPLRAQSKVDLVTAVAPYVPTDAIELLPTDVQCHEPRRALDGGADGLDLVRRVIAEAGELLTDEGWLLIEVGGDQDAALAPTLAEAAFKRVEPWTDDDGDLRGIAAQRG